MHPSMHSSIRPSMHSSIHSSMHSSIHAFIHPSMHSSMHADLHPALHRTSSGRLSTTDQTKFADHPRSHVHKNKRRILLPVTLACLTSSLRPTVSKSFTGMLGSAQNASRRPVLDVQVSVHFTSTSATAQSDSDQTPESLLPTSSKAAASVFQ